MGWREVLSVSVWVVKARGDIHACFVFQYTYHYIQHWAHFWLLWVITSSACVILFLTVLLFLNFPFFPLGSWSLPLFTTTILPYSSDITVIKFPVYLARNLTYICWYICVTYFSPHNDIAWWSFYVNIHIHLTFPKVSYEKKYLNILKG